MEAVTSCAAGAGQVQALGEMLSALVVQTHSVQAVRAAVEEAGGFAAQLADIEEVAAFHGDAHELLVHRFFKKDRPALFELAGKLRLKATSSDDSVLAALAHAREHSPSGATSSRCRPRLRRMSQSRASRSPRATGGAREPTGAVPAWWRGGTSRPWCSATWPRNCAPATWPCSAPTSTPTGAPTCCPGKIVSQAGRLLREGSGCPSTPAGFVAAPPGRPPEGCRAPGRRLPRQRRPGHRRGWRAAPSSAAAVRAAMPRPNGWRPRSQRRMPERSTARRSWRAPPTGSPGIATRPCLRLDPEIKDKLGRQLAGGASSGGINIGPYEAAKHIAGVTARELSMVRNRHITLKKLNAAIADVVNAFAELDVVKAWGDGSTVAADGTQVEHLHRQSPGRDQHPVRRIRRHRLPLHLRHLRGAVLRLHPVRGVGAVHLIEGLLANTSDIQPSTVHADTQGQNFPVFALATLFGFRPDAAQHPQLQGPDLLRASEKIAYPHIAPAVRARRRPATSSTGS